MAPPPLPESNTGRFFVDYEGPYGRHSFQLRGNFDTDPQSAIPSISSLLNAVKPVIHQDTIFTGVRYALTGSNVSNPVGFTPIQGTATGTLAPEFYPRFFAFWGRGPDGRETRLTFFGGNIGVTSDYRIVPGENATIASVITLLNTTSIWTTISGSRPVWKSYANIAYNSHFQRKRRTSA